ncbi:MAG: TonB-dependent receptor domain-containing protein, partial [Methylocystis sp.]
VYRGPSSAMFGNYAYGGAINFRTYSGAQIDGADTGSEAGSFGYINNYVRVGKKVGDIDFALFLSDVRGDGFLLHNAYSNQTGNLVAKWTPVPTDRFTLKYLFNNSFAEQNLTTPLTTYYLNPFQHGCSAAIIASPYCFFTIAPRNGVTGGGAALSQSFAQLGAHQHTLRHITGLRWEHDFDNDTTLRTQVTYNYLDNINGTTIPPRLAVFGIPVLRGPAVGLNVTTDITSFAPLFGYPARHYLGFVYENVKSTFRSFTQVANVWNYGMVGGAAGKIDSYHSNISLRAREEVALSKDLTAVVGFSSNWNRVWGVNTIYNYRQPTLLMNLPSETAVDNDYWNTAPEVSLTYRFAPDWQLRTRYAAGYGTPTFTMLTSTPNGVGANPLLKAQTNMGVDVGVDWTPGPDLTVSLTGYHEWFRNEILTLFTGFPTLTVYSLNLPSAIHRGLELSTDWRFYEGWQFITAYTHNQQFITNFVEELPAGGPVTAVRDRSGKWIPNVPLHTLTARVAYDVPHGEFKGVGAFAEYVFKSSYYVDPANLLRIPGYGLLNLNVHYNRDIVDFYFKNVEVYVSLNNVFDRKFAAGIGVAQNTVVGNIETPAVLLANSVAAIKAGQPRAIIGGVKFKF